MTKKKTKEQIRTNVWEEAGNLIDKAVTLMDTVLNIRDDCTPRETIPQKQKPKVKSAITFSALNNAQIDVNQLDQMRGFIGYSENGNRGVIYESIDPYKTALNSMESVKEFQYHSGSKMFKSAHAYNIHLSHILADRLKSQTRLAIKQIYSEGFQSFIEQYFDTTPGDYLYFSDDDFSLLLNPLNSLSLNISSNGDNDGSRNISSVGLSQRYRTDVVSMMANKYYDIIGLLLFYRSCYSPKINISKLVNSEKGNITTVPETEDDKMANAIQILMDVAAYDCEKIADMAEILSMNAIMLFYDNAMYNDKNTDDWDEEVTNPF